LKISKRIYKYCIKKSTKKLSEKIKKVLALWITFLYNEKAVTR
jgi:hypothetical protein